MSQSWTSLRFQLRSILHAQDLSLYREPEKWPHFSAPQHFSQVQVKQKLGHEGQFFISLFFCYTQPTYAADVARRDRLTE